MIRKIAWNTFKNTGNIDTFLELKQITDIEENIKAENNEIVDSKRNSNRKSRKERSDDKRKMDKIN